MPYAQLDDRYDDHRKVKRAWRRCPAAVGLHAMAITYCNRHKSDGDLEADWVEEKLALLKPRERKVAVDVLVDVGLFERRGEDYYVHDFLQWNRSAKQRDALAEQGRRGGYAKAAAKASEPDGDGSGPGHRNGHSQGSSQGHSPGSGEGSSTPRHATPTVRQNVNTNAELRSAVLECFTYWQERCGHPQAQLDAKRQRSIEGRLKDRKRHHSGDRGRAILDVRQAIDGAAAAPYVDERGKRHDDIELICRNVAKLEDFMGRADAPVVPIRDGMSELDRKRFASANRLMGGAA